MSISSDKNQAAQVTKILIPDAGSMDTQYCELLSATPVKISQNWFLTTSSTPLVSFVSSAPVLTVYSNLPDDVYKEDASLTI